MNGKEEEQGSNGLCDDAMAITYNNLYLDIRQQLKRSGIEAATLEARELVCFGTDKTRDERTRHRSTGAGAGGPPSGR